MQKTVMITGANGNLGTAVVKKFLEEEYKVIAVDTSANHLAFAIHNPAFELLNIDLSDESITEVVILEAIQKFKKIDAAIFLAGGFAMGNIKQTKASQIKEMISLNFDTAYHAARPVFEHMLQNGYGRIVFVGARPALKSEDGKNMIAYALSKSLLFKLAEILNETARGKNIVASVIVPSTIDTPANRTSIPKADPANWVSKEQIAETLSFICSDKGMALRESVFKLYNNA